MGKKNIYEYKDPYSGKSELVTTSAKPQIRQDVTITDDDTPKNPTLPGNTGSVYNYTPYTSGFKPSKAYTDAMAYTNSLLERLSSGKTSYSDKLDAIMGKIENRPQFNYDFNTDPLFQNALASAMASGQTAMQDTIGQASALTGGYGSSYATSAANQAYNASLKGAYDSLPSYYNIARDAYDKEGEALYNQLGMYRTADESEYARLNNAYNANLNNAESIYGKENSEYWNRANYNRQVAESNANLAYKYAALEQDKAYSDAKLKEDARQFDEKNNAKAVKSLDSNDRKDLINAVQAYGTGQNSKLWDIYDMLATQGYSTDELDAIIATNEPQPVYTVNDNGYYEDQFKNNINLGLEGNPAAIKGATFRLKSGEKMKTGSKYEDDYGNEWTYEQLKDRNWLKRIK